MLSSAAMFYTQIAYVLVMELWMATALGLHICWEKPNRRCNQSRLWYGAVELLMKCC